MNHAKALSLVGILGLLVGSSGCQNRLIAGYEVLSVPRGADQYAAGKQWINGVGPSGPPLVQSKEEAGLDRLDAKANQNTKASVEAALSDWVKAALGIQADKQATVTLSKVKYQYVDDGYGLSTTGNVLWETIVADSMDLDLGDSASMTMSAETLGAKLTTSLNGSAKLSAEGNHSNSFHITSSRPLVVAIRVISPVYSVKPSLSPLDLSGSKRGKAQPASLGYVVTVETEVNPMDHVAVVRIDNAGLPQFGGLVHTFKHGEPWISPSRTAISAVDRSATDAFVWDKLSIRWNEDLQKCSLEVVRQYVSIKTIDSGLKGTR